MAIGFFPSNVAHHAPTYLIPTLWDFAPSRPFFATFLFRRLILPAVEGEFGQFVEDDGNGMVRLGNNVGGTTVNGEGYGTCITRKIRSHRMFQKRLDFRFRNFRADLCFVDQHL